MSPELDTYSITKRVKEVLTDNNLGTWWGPQALPAALALPSLEHSVTGTSNGSPASPEDATPHVRHMTLTRAPAEGQRGGSASGLSKWPCRGLKKPQSLQQ